MTDDARMTVRLTPAIRRKIERFAAREGISLDEALSRLILSAPDETQQRPRSRRYRLKPREVGFGFEIANARWLAAATLDEDALRKQRARR